MQCVADIKETLRAVTQEKTVHRPRVHRASQNNANFLSQCRGQTHNPEPRFRQSYGGRGAPATRQKETPCASACFLGAFSRGEVRRHKGNPGLRGPPIAPYKILDRPSDPRPHGDFTSASSRVVSIARRAPRVALGQTGRGRRPPAYAFNASENFRVREATRTKGPVYLWTNPEQECKSVLCARRNT